MVSRILRLVLLLGVILGVVLPKTSVALADLGVIDGRSVLICTGHGLEEIALAPDRDPVPRSPAHAELPCLLVHALDGSSPPVLPEWVALARDVQPVERDHLWLSARVSPTRFARAPPRA